MAKLNSIEKVNFLSIKPIRYENNEEEWVISELIFFKENKKALWTVASILQDYELEAIKEAMQSLISNKISEYKSDFLEPNLKLTINREKETIRVSANYAEGADYENRKNKDNLYKDIEFYSNEISIKTFIKELELELQKLKKNKVHE